MDASGGEAGDQASLSSWQSDIGIHINFQKSEASLPFEEMNSAHLSRCQRGVKPTVQMRRRHSAFARVSTGETNMPSTSEMKGDPEFKALQGNPAFF